MKCLKRTTPLSRPSKCQPCHRCLKWIPFPWNWIALWIIKGRYVKCNVEIAFVWRKSVHTNAIYWVDLQTVSSKENWKWRISLRYVTSNRHPVQVQVAVAVAIQIVPILIRVSPTAQAAVALVAYVNHVDIAKRNVHTNETQIRMKVVPNRVVHRHHRHHPNMVRSAQSIPGNPLEKRRNNRNNVVERRPIQCQFLTLKPSSKTL